MPVAWRMELSRIRVRKWQIEKHTTKWEYVASPALEYPSVP